MKNTASFSEIGTIIKIHGKSYNGKLDGKNNKSYKGQNVNYLIAGIYYLINLYPNPILSPW